MKGSLKTIKLSLLYNDKIILPKNFVGLITPDKNQKASRSGGERGVVSFTCNMMPEGVRQQLSELEDAKFIQFADSYVEPQDLVTDGLFVNNLENYCNFERLDDGLRIITASAELLDADKSACVHGIFDGEAYNLRALETFFDTLAATWFLEASTRSLPLLTDSSIVHEMLTKYLTPEDLRLRFVSSSRQKVSALSYKVFDEFIPDINDVPFDDILELKVKFHDELQLFSSGMARLSGKIEPTAFSADFRAQVEKLIETELRPSLYELERSLRTSTRKIVTTVFNNIRDPKSYLPFGATFLANVSPVITGLAALGIAGFKTLYDLYIERKTISEKNSLIFLVKAREEWPALRRG
jgi:hypothetical protein